ncbi:ATP synthase subunit I [Clostridium sp.]|uniref:ATP synthase subunit I n=1 Tax=Clostridium sp. TaxID=1506 RepID=UPI002FDDB253
MDKNILRMTKMVFLINALIGVLLAGLSQLFLKNYGLFILLGMCIAMFNFFLNSILGAVMLYKFKNSSSLLYLISFIIRIVIAAGIGYITFRYNKYDVIAYLFGYTSNLLGIYIYSAFESGKNNV